MIFLSLGINYFCHFDYPQKKKLQNTDIFPYVSFEEKDKTLQRMASLQRVFWIEMNVLYVCEQGFHSLTLFLRIEYSF